MNLVAILEDNKDRMNAMRDAIQTLDNAEAIFLDNAPDMIRWFRVNAGRISLLSLDHDLDPLFKRDGLPADPGDGRDVAKFLATQRPVCPIILHSTNGEMAREMEQDLSSAGWNCTRVVPFGGMDWIASTWLSVVRTKLKLEP